MTAKLKEEAQHENVLQMQSTVHQEKLQKQQEQADEKLQLRGTFFYSERWNHRSS